MSLDAGTSPQDDTAACPLAAPSSGRTPGLLALAAAAAGVFVAPVFFSLAAGLLALLSLLLSPPRCRWLGFAALAAAATGLRVLI